MLLIKNTMEFPGAIKNKMMCKFPGVFVLDHGLIRALLSLTLNFMSIQLTLAAGKDQLTPGKSGKYDTGKD